MIFSNGAILSTMIFIGGALGGGYQQAEMSTHSLMV